MNDRKRHFQQQIKNIEKQYKKYDKACNDMLTIIQPHADFHIESIFYREDDRRTVVLINGHNVALSDIIELFKKGEKLDLKTALKKAY